MLQDEMNVVLWEKIIPFRNESITNQKAWETFLFQLKYYAAYDTW